MTTDPLITLVSLTITSCLDDDGRLNPHDAALEVMETLYSVATVTPVTPHPQALWDRFMASLHVHEWWEHITPEERASFPLTEPVIRQNQVLLEATTDYIYSSAHRPAKVSHG